jgi:tetratricopeptide (TPR) repeat protein
MAWVIMPPLLNSRNSQSVLGRAAAALLFLCLLLVPVSFCQSPPAAAAKIVDPIDELIRQGIQAHQAGRLVDAEKFYLAALEEAEKLPDLSPKLARVLSLLASLNLQKGEDQKALGMRLRALEVDEKIYGPKDPHVALDLGGLSIHYRRLQMEVEEEASIGRALEIEQSSAEMTTQDHDRILRNAISYYQLKKRYSEAEALLKRSLEIAEGSSQPDNVRIVQVRQDLAQILRLEGKSEEAELILSHPPPPVDAGTARGASPDPSGPVSDMERGNFYRRDGKFQDAEFYYNRAIAALENASTPSAAMTLAAALDRLGDLYIAEAREMEAEKLFLRAIALREQNVNPKLSQSVRSLGHPYELLNLYRRQGRLQEMEPIFLRELKIQESVLGADDVSVAITLRGLASIFREEKMPGDALPLLARALQIEESNRGLEDSGLAGFLDEYAGLLEEVGRSRDAAEARAHAERIRNRKAATKPAN